MASPHGQTDHEHADRKVQKEFERIGRQSTVLPASQNIIQAGNAGTGGSGPGTGDIIITSKDNSVIINKYDLSVWNYSTNWEYMELNGAPYPLLMSNRVGKSGWIPMRCDNCTITDMENYVIHDKSLQIYEPTTDIDPQATARALSVRPWFIFAPRRYGNYQLTATVRLKVDHIRSGVYLNGIVNGILIVEKVNKAILDLYTFYNPFVYGNVITPTPPPVLPDITLPQINPLAHWEILDEVHRLRKAGIMGGTYGMSPFDPAAIFGSNIELQNYVNTLFLSGTTEINMQKDELAIVWYRFDYVSLWDSSGDGEIDSCEFLNRADIKELYENIDIQWIGYRGNPVSRATLDKTNFSSMIENYNLV